MSNNVSVRDLLEAGVHFGHLTRSRNPKMSKYIFGVRNKINIIDLDHTLPMLRHACKFLEGTASKGGKILFVGTKRAASILVKEFAQSVGMPYVDHRWLGGMLTNFRTIKQSIRRMKELETICSDGTLEHITKKEGLTIKRELDKLERDLGGVKDMSSLPDAIFVIDVGKEKISLQEAQRLSIPVVAVVDTNYSPIGIEYPIPGNDDAMRAIRLYLAESCAAIQRGIDSQRATAAGKFQEDFVEVVEDVTPSTTASNDDQEAQAQQ